MTDPSPVDVRVSPGVRRVARVLVVATTTALLVLAAEAALRVFLPYSYFTIGHPDSVRPSLTAERYGWGFAPHEVVRTGNPDTGAVYVAPVNSRGWRDVEHDLANPAGAFRILILGDSATFGAIVPAERTLPRLLEAALQADGYNVEVIAMAYGGFATDQELEAFSLEGANYHPNLVVVQTSENDPVENAGRAPYKPFKYSLTEAGTLVRTAVPRAEVPPARQRIKDWLLRSELFKRVYGMRAARETAVPRGDALRYRVNEDRLKLLGRLFHLPADAPAIGGLIAHVGKDIPAESLRALLDPVIRFYDMDQALRIFEAHWINTFSHGPGYATTDPGAPDWRLTFALFDELRRVTRDRGADLALFPEMDVGHYKWLAYWGWLEDRPDVLAAFLSSTQAVRDYAERTGTGFIEAINEHVRARNDPHANAQGQAAMAENIRRYVRATYNLEPYRTARR